MSLRSKNSVFLADGRPKAVLQLSAQTCPQRVQGGVIMREQQKETLHRNLGTVTGAFIGRRSRHFWHFSCALGGAASSAEKRDEGWSAAPAAWSPWENVGELKCQRPLCV